MTNLEEQKKLFREKLENFKEGEDYSVSYKLDKYGEIETTNYTIYSPLLKSEARQILSSIRNWGEDEKFVYEIKISEDGISVGRSFSISSSSTEEEKGKMKRTFEYGIVSGERGRAIEDSQSKKGLLEDAKKYCCGKEYSPNDNFCQTCGQRLVESQRSCIREITDQEAQQIEGSQQRPFFSKAAGKLVLISVGIVIGVAITMLIQKKKLGGKK